MLGERGRNQREAMEQNTETLAGMPQLRSDIQIGGNGLNWWVGVSQWEAEVSGPNSDLINTASV